MSVRYRNEAINKLLDDNTITQEEYDILFSDKKNYFAPMYQDTSGKPELLKKFYQVLNKVMQLQNEKTSINFSYIFFPFFASQQIYDHINLNKITSISFDNAEFFDYTSFMLLEHKLEFSFNRVIFHKKADFQWATFTQNISFIGATFEDEASFSGVQANALINLVETSFNKLDLHGCHFSRLTIGNLSGWEEGEKVLIDKKHFANKETSRLIKAHFEKQNNITESNKYFAIEQELYLDELKNDSLWKNKGVIFTVWLHQLISKSGTSWLRVLTSIIFFTIFTFLGYEYFNDFIHIKEGFGSSLNIAIQLIDPLSMFKADNDIYEKHQAVGFMIRIITIYLFYQFILAFRNNTRRK